MPSMIEREVAGQAIGASLRPTPEGSHLVHAEAGKPVAPQNYFSRGDYGSRVFQMLNPVQAVIDGLRNGYNRGGLTDRLDASSGRSSSSAVLYHDGILPQLGQGYSPTELAGYHAPSLGGAGRYAGYAAPDRHYLN